VPPPLRPEPTRPAGIPPPPRRDDLADLGRSQWDLGPDVPVRQEPFLAPAEPVPAAPPAPPATPPRPAPKVSAAAPQPRPAAPRVPGVPAPRAPAPVAPAPVPPAPVAPAPVLPQAARPAPAPAGPGAAHEGAGVVEVHVRRAEPWRRATAWAIDALPFAAAAVALARAFVREATVSVPGPVTGLDLLDFVARERVIVLSVAAVATVALGVYTTLAHALAGATLGKRLLRLRIVGPDGTRPSLGRSAARAALALVSAGALGLGFLLALFTPSGRALHDLLARTWVVDAQP
jgi:uncharacterized RDD family membrane protein YckC